MLNSTATLITGASSGLGEVLSLRLAALGHRVFAVARSRDKLAALASRHANITAMPADVSCADQVEKLIADVERQAPIGVLINNAAVFQMRPFETQDVATIDRILDTNTKGTIYCCRFVAPRMIARKAGRIIQISSVAGTRGLALQSVYCASKHAVNGFSDALAQELLPHGIQVTTLCPGGIDTPLWRSGENPYPGDLDKTMKPEEVAQMVEFILDRPAGTVYKKVVFFPANEWH